MNSFESASTSKISRRGFLGLAGAATMVPILAACTPGGSTATSSAVTGVVKFWDMPWGPPAYSTAGKKITLAYKPASGLQPASYQTVQWANFYETYSGAIASKTGPAVGTGSSFLSLQFADQGAIAYSDGVIAQLKKDGTYSDFLPGTLDSLKTSAGYSAIPWALDIRVLWYRKSLLEKAGASVPTDWDSYITAGKALKKIGVYGFGAGAGSGNNLGQQAIMSLILNNGGGLFDKQGNLDVVTSRNIETIDFIQELVGQGILDPGSVSYSQQDQLNQWKAGAVGMGLYTPGLDTSLGDTSGDILVADPLTGPHGTKGTIAWSVPIMMFKNTPSVDASEAFVVYYLDQIKTYWQKNLVTLIPVRQSIADLPQYKADKQNARIVKVWQPVEKAYNYPAPHPFAALAAIDGGSAMTTFAQTVFGGKVDSKTALTGLQASLEPLMKS